MKGYTTLAVILINHCGMCQNTVECSCQQQLLEVSSWIDYAVGLYISVAIHVTLTSFVTYLLIHICVTLLYS